MKPLKIGIVGCGYIGSKRAAVAKSNPASEVVVVADIDIERPRIWPRQLGVTIPMIGGRSSSLKRSTLWLSRQPMIP